ncbi:MAG: hypothetical protein ACSHX5_12925 [Phycisphaerales bacterium]
MNIKAKLICAFLAVLLNLLLVNAFESDVKAQVEVAMRAATDSDGNLNTSQAMEALSSSESRWNFALFPVGGAAIQSNGGELPLWGRLGQAACWGIVVFGLLHVFVPKASSKT